MKTFKILSLSLLFFPLFFKGNFAHEVKAINNAKTIYIDVSLNDNFSSENHDDMFIRYNDGNDHVISLNYIDNDIYQSSEDISNDIFSNQNYGFEIYSSNYHSSFINGDNLLKNDNYNYVALSNNNGVEGFGYYSEKIANLGATYATQRVWLYGDSNHDYYSNDGWGNKKTSAVAYFAEDKWNIINMELMLNSNGEAFYFADIPSNITSIHYYQISSGDNHSYLIYNDASISYLNYGVCYFYKDSIDGHYLSVSTDVVYNASALLLANVVTAYLTYGTLDSNGAKTDTMKNVFTTWFDKKEATTDELKNTKILDYTGYSANGNSYEGLEKTSSFSVNEKWNTMCSQAGIDPKTGQARNMFSFLTGVDLKLVLFIGGSILLIGVIAVLYIVYKRKRYLSQ